MTTNETQQQQKDEKVVQPLENETEVKTSTPQLSEHEERASTMGWVTKDEWIEAGHDADDWKPAKVFLEHGEMIGKIRAQNKDLADAANALRFMNEQNKQAYERGYQNAITELRQAKRAALAEGDLVKADQIDERIDATKEELDRVRIQADIASRNIPRAPQIDPEHIEWVKRNPWYDTDKVMAKFADAMAVEFIQSNKGQVTPDQVRNYVEKEVRKEFPERARGKSTVGAPHPDGEGRTSAGGNKGKDTLDSRLSRAKAEMTDEQKSIMKTMIKATGMTEKRYLEQYLS